MIAGPNGSGKSTLTSHLVEQGIDFRDYLNADEIVLTLGGSQQAVAAEAQALVRRKRQAALDEGRDHTFETVLSHPSHIDHLQLARAAGFEVFVYFVATEDPAINLGRVKNRVLHGGHDVPQDRILARYARSIANLPQALSVAHEGAVFDNSSTSEPMRLLAKWSDGILQQQMLEPFWPNWWRGCLPAVQAALAGKSP